MDDLISRQAAIEALKEEYNRRRTGDGLRLAWIEKAINSVPTADTEQKKGKWRNIQIGKWLGVECTACKIARDRREVPHDNGGIVVWKFCPECGADLRGGSENGK